MSGGEGGEWAYLAEVEAREQSATDGPWWCEDTPYAEYWPDDADAEFITGARAYVPGPAFASALHSVIHLMTPLAILGKLDKPATLREYIEGFG